VKVRDKGSGRRRLLKVLLDPRLRITLEPLTRTESPPLMRSVWRPFKASVQVDIAPEASTASAVWRAHQTLEETAVGIWEDLLGALAQSVRHEQAVENHKTEPAAGTWFPLLVGETFHD
jgi:hypothetical protein